MMTTMTSSTAADLEPGAPRAHGRRSEAFAQAVAGTRRRADGAVGDGAARVVGLVAMVVGVVGAFLAYVNSLGLDDSRDIASTQVLAIAFVAVAVAGAGLYVAGVVARVLRLWLLRQLVESQDRADALLAALGRAPVPGAPIGAAAGEVPPVAADREDRAG